MSNLRPTKELTIARILEAEQDIRALGVDRLALFGSVVRDEANEESDVDLLVQFRPGQKSIDAFLSLADLLESRVGHRVELLTTEALSLHIGPYILAEARDVLRPQ